MSKSFYGKTRYGDFKAELESKSYKPTKVGKWFAILSRIGFLVFFIGAIVGAIHAPESEATDEEPWHPFIWIGAGILAAFLIAKFAKKIPREDTMAFLFQLILFSLLAISGWIWYF